MKTVAEPAGIRTEAMSQGTLGVPEHQRSWIGVWFVPMTCLALLFHPAGQVVVAMSVLTVSLCRPRAGVYNGGRDRLFREYLP